MCGIIGYLGREEAESILIEGLQKLEYRGYDSVGIVCRDSHKSALTDNSSDSFNVSKVVGKVADLDRLCKKHHLSGTAGIGHCRWATHGAVNWKNAHPHISSDGKVVLVHNGIIENYLELKDMLLSKGYKFNSEGDSETVANLLAYLISSKASSDGVKLQGADNLSVYTRAVLSLKHWLKGAYALSIMFLDVAQEIFAIRKESPLVVGYNKHDSMESTASSSIGGLDSLLVASDIIPLAGKIDTVLYLKNHEVARLSREGDSFALEYILSDGSEADILSCAQEIDRSSEDVDKQGYAHFMLKEIYEQPNIFSKLYSTYIDENYMPNKFSFSEEQKEILKGIERIIFVSCGTSYHSSLYASYLIEQYLSIPASVEYASEFRYRQPVLDKNTLVLALSQSGETADTLAALNLAEEAQAKTLGVVNVSTSSIARMVDIMLYTDCGSEIGVASTKAYTAQMLLLFYLMLYMGKLRGTMQEKDIQALVEKSKMLPQLADKILSKSKILNDLGRAYAGYQHMLYLGRGLLYPLALEGALKLKEISYIHAEGYAAAEMKHGPIALIDSTMPIVVCAPKHDVLYEKIQSNISEVKARGGRVLALVSEGDKNIGACDDVFELPDLSIELDPILFSIPLQLFAYYAAVAKAYDPDQPRNLAKSVTVE